MKSGHDADDFFGLICESSDCFLAVIESSSSCIMDLIKVLHQESVEDGSRVSDLKIFLFTDDIIRYTFSRTLVSRQAVEDNADPSEDEGLNEENDGQGKDIRWIRFIHDILNKMLTIGGKSQHLGPAQTRLFVESMTTSSENLKLIPRRDTLTTLLTQCEKAMTIDEFTELYMEPVDIVFDSELVHPMQSWRP